MGLRFLVPESIQTTTVDCGPAVLQSLLEGFGIHASYGRLREACQTSLDGTSIDTIEIVARELGLDAEQVMLPPDYLILDPKALPAVVVVRLPSGFTHFVLVWRRVGPWLQIMDPASGRRWTRARDFLAGVYLHQHVVPAEGWREWAGSDAALAILRKRIESIANATAIVDRTLGESGWIPLARLDAATRMIESLVRSGAIRRGGEAAALLESLMRREETISASFWSVFATEDESEVSLRGAVLIRIARESGAADFSPPDRFGRLKPALSAAEGPAAPPTLQRVVRMLSDETRATLPIVALASLVLGVTGIIEGLLFRSLFALVGETGLPQQRLFVLGGFVALVSLLLGLEYAVTRRVLAHGRELEARFTAAFLQKLAALRSDYFGSRIVSDLAERAHNLTELRMLPFLFSRALRSSAALALTVAALAWLVPDGIVALLAGTALLLALAFAFGPAFAEIDVRVRTHAGALTRFYLDALTGLTTVHAHCGERSVRREHEALLTDWMRALRRQITAVVSQTTVLSLVGFAVVALLIRHTLVVAEDSARVLLVAYWGMHLPVLASEIANSVQMYSALRAILLRIFELLDSPSATVPVERQASACRPLSIEFRDATFAAGGHDILRDVTLAIPAGASIAIVGPSGAGKSTLVGALLGWSEPRKGDILIDGEPLTPERLAALRRETAWVDPGVHLFNASMEENLRYSTGLEEVARLPVALNEAELYEVLHRLRDSQMPLGESGSMLSGGEGQRVRLGRSMMQSEPRLVILDEAFRGLDRPVRRELLRRCRAMWSASTFLFVTHDVEETAGCDRVIVIEGGRIVEADAPAALLARSDSHFARMAEASRVVHDEVWMHPRWRRVEIRDGRLQEAER